MYLWLLPLDMPGTLAYGFHESNRGEYLAQFFLCALGVSAPVIRQEDIGVDFFCSLAKEENKKLTFHSPFMVQQGAVDSKEFVYGGYGPKDTEKKKWRKEGIEWLFSQELPLFACVTDRVAGRCKLYSTSAMWLLRYKFENMTAIELCPDATHDPLRESKGEKIENAEHGDGHLYRVPLGNPVVDLGILNFDNDQRERAIAALKEAVAVEQRNITFRRLGVHQASWFTDVRANDVESLRMIGGAVFWDGYSLENVSNQTDALKNIAVTLALNLKAREADHDQERLNCLAPLFRLFPGESIPKWLMDYLPADIKKEIDSAKHLFEG